MAEATPGWDQEANQKMGELSNKFKDLTPRDVKGNALVGKPGRISKQAGKVNAAFDKTPQWIESEVMDQIYEDFIVNEYNKNNINDKENFADYLIDKVIPTLTGRYSDLMNSMMHHEQAVHLNAEIAPLTKVESEKVFELLDKTSEAVFKYVRNNGKRPNHIGEQKWKSARNWIVEILNALPSGEGSYKKV